ncbi:MAG: DUF3015 family protein [Burkholderiaceae bacterium]
MNFKSTLIIGTLAALPATAWSCGWGSKMFDGQSGVGPQVFAATTNGTSGNQVFGISSGTSGCSQDAMVRSNWKTAMFIDGNKERLARDMSRGSGESLDSLAQLIGVTEAHKAHFFRVTKDNFERIYASDMISAQDIMNGLRAVLAADQTLVGYTAKI